MRASRKTRREAREQPVETARTGRLSTFGQSRKVWGATSLILVLPCLWQSRIQAGDLSSHLYNAWLAQLIGEGRAPGLSIVPQSSNVLFDLLLSTLFRLCGAEAAQRIAVMIAVLVFAWGAMAFVFAVAVRRAWHLLPIIGILAYGWVFHMGLFNFYLSLGLSFLALATAWKEQPGRIALALGLLALAYTAQAIAPAWAAALLAYRWAAARLSSRGRTYLLSGAVLLLAALHAMLAAAMRTNWMPSQILLITGADQAFVYGEKYWLVCGLLLLVMGSLGWASRRIADRILVHFSIVTAAGIFILPTWVWLPHYNHALVFIAERMSLAAGVLICALVGCAPVRNWHRWAIAAVGLLFFSFLYTDERALNGLEDRMQEAVSQIPAGQRVISAIDTSGLRANPVTHMIDRACIGRCYSYANYEPSSAAFRIRVAGRSPIVASTDADASRMQVGGYAVKPRDVPLYRLMLDQSREIVTQSMPPGALTGMSIWDGL